MKKRLLLLLLTIPHHIHTLSADHLHQFMWANIDTFANNPQRALQRYNHITPQSTWSYHGYIPFLFDYQKYDIIVSLADTIDNHFAHNVQLQLLLALSFKKMNDHTQGNKRIIALAGKHPAHATIILRAAQIYVEQKEPQKALTVLDTYLNRSPHKANSFLFFFLKSQIYAQLKDHNSALENIEKCIELQPSHSQAWLMRAMLEEQKGNIQHAINNYTHFLSLTNSNNEQSSLHHHVTELMMRQQPAVNPCAHLNLSYESHLDQAILYFTKKLYPQSLIECNHYLQRNPDSIKAKLLKVQIYTAQGNISGATSLLLKEMNHNPDSELWYKTLYHLQSAVPDKNIIETLFKRHAQKHPHNLYAQLYTADMILRSTHYHDALSYLLSAENLASTIPQKTAILYQQALIFYDIKELAKADTALKKLTSYDPKNAAAYNLLAYSAAKQRNFEYAHNTIEASLALDPHNHHFLDTKGYIFYKEKNYDHAQKIFNSLITLHKDDACILTHLKKIYNKQNNQQKDKDASTLHTHNIKNDM